MLSVLLQNQKNLSLSERVRKGNKRYACGARGPQLGEQFKMVTEHALSRDPQPARIPPTGAGFMPLYCAAQWIATAGHAVPWDVPADDLWGDAYQSLCDAIASEDVKINGERLGEKGTVPSHLFANCEISHHAKLWLPDEGQFYLSSCPYIDETRWLDGMNDKMVGKNGLPNWERLIVQRKDVWRLWPFNDAQATLRTVRTGMRGRPDSAPHVEREHIARWERGEALTSVKAEALALWNWIRSRHPEAASGKPKTIEERIRTEHRARRSGPGK
jgi:hypothetical protein